MDVVFLLLFLLAAILFALTALGVPQGRLNLLACGLLAWVLVYVIKAIQGVH